MLNLEGIFQQAKSVPIGVRKDIKRRGLRREMGVLESGPKLEAVAEQTIDSEVFGPDQRDEQRKPAVGLEPEGTEIHTRPSACVTEPHQERVDPCSHQFTEANSCGDLLGGPEQY